MIATWIKNSLTLKAKQKLSLKLSIFCHTRQGDRSYKDNGPTKLHLIFDAADSSTTVGISNLKVKLIGATLSDYNGNVKDMLDEIETVHNKIVTNRGSHDNFMLNIFNTLETSKDVKFLKWVEGKRSDWEDDELEMNETQLIATAVRKYNNIKS